MGPDVVPPAASAKAGCYTSFSIRAAQWSTSSPALGAIAIFCEASNVSDVRLVQCDQVVTSDRWIEPEQLAEFEISGFGYSDMSPAILHLAADPEVESVLVLTDGYIDYPEEPPPYRVLWRSLAITSCPSSPPMGRWSVSPR